MAALGVGLAVVGTFCSATGYTLQKTAHNRAARELAEDVARAESGTPVSKPPEASDPAEDKAAPSAEGVRSATPASKDERPLTSETPTSPPLAPAKPKSYWRYWQFPAGLGFLVLGSVFAVFVFGLAGQSELAPMGAVTMIFNTILAWRFLGEPFTRVDLIATCLMASGTTIAVAFGKPSDAEFTLDELIDLLDRRVVWWVFGGEMVVIASFLIYVHTVGSAPVRSLTHFQQRLDSFGRPFIGGALSGFTGFLTKSSVEVAFNAVDTGDGDDFARWEVYAFLVALGCCIFFQLKYMNSGLGRYDSMMTIPIYQSVLVIAAAVSGLIFFDEIEVQDDTSVTLFIVGCCVTASGIAVLLLKKRGDTDPMTTDEAADETHAAHAPHVGIVQLTAALGNNSMANAEAIAAGDDESAQADEHYPRRRSTAGGDLHASLPPVTSPTTVVVSPSGVQAATAADAVAV